MAAMLRSRACRREMPVLPSAVVEQEKLGEGLCRKDRDFNAELGYGALGLKTEAAGQP
jgi:hypothetical protein